MPREKPYWKYLQELQPDLILLESPAEAETLLPCVLNEQMEPPVALLAYQPDQPQNAVFYPFAEFSPEWQTIVYALRNEVPLRFFDLPLVHSMAQNQEPHNTTEEQQEEIIPTVYRDPFDYLAEAAGYTDGESWWETTIEHRKDSADVFQAVKEAVTALREELPEHTSPRDQLREAWMRKMIRTAQKENFERIAVVCGAWHVPALENMPKVKEDNELLKGLPKIKIECTWIPLGHISLEAQTPTADPSALRKDITDYRGHAEIHLVTEGDFAGLEQLRHRRQNSRRFAAQAAQLMELALEKADAALPVRQR